MVYAIILAAGSGKRLDIAYPIKALVQINNKPIFMYSLDTMINSKYVDQVILVVNKEYKDNFTSYLNDSKCSKVKICLGDDKARYLSLNNAMSYLKHNFKLKKDDIILTHDAARINLTNELIKQNIVVTKKYGYATTLLPLSDSICKMESKINYIDRNNLFLVQTPQTIQYKYWKVNNEVDGSTDLFTYLNLHLNQKHIVVGNIKNYKITYKEDL